MSIRTLTAAAALAILAACSAPAGIAVAAGRTLAAYDNDEQLAQVLERWRAEAQRRREAERRSAPLAMQSAPPPPMAAPAPAAAPAAKAADAAGQAAAESITNVQTAGVDEGGIVKRAGDHLLVLRRGRLFTLKVGGDSLAPVSMVDAFAPNADPRGAWYDELLVSGSQVVVVGYSYARGGTEIGLFEIDPRGGLHYRNTWHLRSYDYYSARNYASRLIGRKLVFYSPTILQPWGTPPMQMLPGLRHWQGPSTPPDWQRILPATRVYRTDDDFDPTQPLALHNVTSCDLSGPEMRCETTAVLGPAGRVFYVSQGSVYVWTISRPRGGEVSSAVFRIPLDGAAPTALKTAGAPIDQLSFLEDDRGHLNVLLRATGAGEGMWGHLRLSGGTALLRVPLAAFGDGRGSAQREHYRALPSGPYTQNRFVGDWLLWGGGAPYGRPPGSGAVPAQAWALRYADAGDAVPLDPGHAVERIEAMGGHAVLVGNDRADLVFSAVRLGRRDASLAGRHVQPDARQGETRTHGFFFRPTSADDGLLGLPILGAGGRAGVPRGNQGSAAVLFLRQQSLAFRPLGELVSQPVMASDGCRASCIDWYGNARPIFIGERVFALLGYELVEGRLASGFGGERIEERRRVNFMPGAPREGGRYSPFGTSGN